MKTYPTTSEILAATILGAAILSVGMLLGRQQSLILSINTEDRDTAEYADYFDTEDDDDVAKCCTCRIPFPQEDDEQVESWVSLVYGDGRLPIYACCAEHLERRLITGG